MKIKNLDHFVITVRNLERCLKFYAGVLGMEHTFANGRHFLAFGNQRIHIHTQKGEFQPAAKHPSCGSQDFCLIAAGDMERIKSEIEGRGWPILEGVVDRRGALGPMRSIYLRDPDGNLVEIASYDVP